MIVIIIKLAEHLSPAGPASGAIASAAGGRRVHLRFPGFPAPIREGALPAI